MGLTPIVGRRRTKKYACWALYLKEATEQESKIEDEEKDIVDQIEKEMKERATKNSVIVRG